MGHGWGKKLAQNNSKPSKVMIHFALKHCIKKTHYMQCVHDSVSFCWFCYGLFIYLYDIDDKN